MILRAVNLFSQKMHDVIDEEMHDKVENFLQNLVVHLPNFMRILISDPR